MIVEPRPEDSHALSLALKLDRAGAGKDLSRRLRVLVGTENEGRLLAACHQAEAMLQLKAAEDARHEVKATVPAPRPEPVQVAEDAPQEPSEEPEAESDEQEAEDGDDSED